MRMLRCETAAAVRALVEHPKSIEAVHGFRRHFGFHIDTSHEVIVARSHREVVDS